MGSNIPAGGTTGIFPTNPTADLSIPYLTKIPELDSSSINNFPISPTP